MFRDDFLFVCIAVRCKNGEWDFLVDHFVSPSIQSHGFFVVEGNVAVLEPEHCGVCGSGVGYLIRLFPICGKGFRSDGWDVFRQFLIIDADIGTLRTQWDRLKCKVDLFAVSLADSRDYQDLAVAGIFKT